MDKGLRYADADDCDMLMTRYSTLVELLCDRAQQAPEQTAYTFLGDDLTETGHLTYGELDRQACAIATQLQTFLKLGDRVLVVYPYSAGLEFIAAFFGCLYAGVVAVTDNPPRNQAGLVQLRDRVLSTQCRAVLSTQQMLAQVEHGLQSIPDLAQQWQALPHIATDTVPQANNWSAPDLEPNSLAFMQHTSGSTGTPKAVMVSHRNLLHNSKLIYQCFEHHEHSRGLMWLPLFHDMGLVGGVVQPLYGGFPVTLMSPISLIQKPVNWLRAMSQTQATTSGGSNFAYDLLCQKVTPEQRETLDLSHWEVAFSGAEPIRAATLEQFVDTFGPCDFRREAFYPCYGMAETTLFITGGRKADPPIVTAIDPIALTQNRVVPAAETVRQVVGCGRVWLGDQLQIIDPETQRPCEPDQVGEIWVAGSGIAQGYWQQPEETQQTFQAFTETGTGPFLRTGDLGFVQDGELFITGRLKDMMILWGRNHYPQHIEQTVEQSHPALRPNCGAAFTITVEDQEHLIVVQEVERTALRQLNVPEVIEAICRAVAEQHIAEVYAVALLKTASIPKTTSGKVQRSACRKGYCDRTLNTIAEWQMPPEQQNTITDLMARQN